MRFLWIRKTGAAVRWLPIGLGNNNEDLAIHVPCPVTDLIRLICSTRKRRDVMRLLRLNPALMLFALSEYQDSHSRSPDSSSEFVSWVQSNLLHALNRVDVRRGPGLVESCSVKKFKRNLLDFYRARSNKKLRKSLLRFLSLTCGLEDSLCKSGVDALVGSNLRADQFKCKQIRRDRTYSLAIEEWLSQVGRDIAVADLVDLAATSQESSQRFNSRLQEEKLASMKQLAYGASHEINNPLANIATRAQTILAVETDLEKRHRLSVIYEQAMRAHEMISDLMLFAHPPALHRTRVSVRLLMSRIVHELRPILENAPLLELRVVIGAGVDHAMLDPTHFSVALESLIQNSIEALSSVGDCQQRIEIRLERTESQELQISIWDNGPGISKDIARHLFDPFFSGREAGRGLGFGLSKAWRIARLHGGTLQYDDSSKTGTLFVLSLPIESTTTSCGSSTVLTIVSDLESDEEAA